MSELILSMDHLRHFVLSANRDLGFVGESGDVIIHACRLLGDELILLEHNGSPIPW